MYIYMDVICYKQHKDTKEIYKHHVKNAINMSNISHVSLHDRVLDGMDNICFTLSNGDKENYYFLDEGPEVWSAIMMAMNHRKNAKFNCGEILCINPNTVE